MVSLVSSHLHKTVGRWFGLSVGTQASWKLGMETSRSVWFVRRLVELDSQPVGGSVNWYVHYLINRFVQRGSG